MVIALASVSALASETMPAAQQTALVLKYCAVCHTDAHLNGGISFEHFDAAKADPGVAAMLVSKLTNGTPLKTTNAMLHDPDAAATVVKMMKTGAMGAAGIPIPDRAIQDALVSALSSETIGASAWRVERTGGSALKASILQEVASPTYAGVIDSYRLIVICDTQTRQGEMEVTWAPGSTKQGAPMTVAVDGGTPFSYKAEGTEKEMFTGAYGTMGTGAALLYTSGANPAVPKVPMRMPAKELRVSDLFPNETVTFPFADLDRKDRGALAACFPK
jgi:hypothetical protein